MAKKEHPWWDPGTDKPQDKRFVRKAMSEIDALFGPEPAKKVAKVAKPASKIAGKIAKASKVVPSVVSWFPEPRALGWDRKRGPRA